MTRRNLPGPATRLRRVAGPGFCCILPWAAAGTTPVATSGSRGGIEPPTPATGNPAARGAMGSRAIHVGWDNPSRDPGKSGWH